VSVMLPEGCPPSPRNPVRHGPAHAAGRGETDAQGQQPGIRECDFQQRAGDLANEGGVSGVTLLVAIGWPSVGKAQGVHHRSHANAGAGTGDEVYPTAASGQERSRQNSGLKREYSGLVNQPTGRRTNVVQG